MNELILKQFEGKDLRHHLDSSGEVWFVAKDVMEILGIKSQAHALRKLDADQGGEVELQSPSGFQKYATVSESGLYDLVMQSNKPSARPFQRWVTKEVLPSIRKTGSYSVLPVKELDPLVQLRLHLTAMERQQAEIVALNASLDQIAIEAKQENDSLTHDQATQLDSEINAKFKEVGIKNFKILGYIKKQVKAAFFENPASFTFKEIPRSGFEQARNIVRNFEVPTFLLKEH